MCSMTTFILLTMRQTFGTSSVNSIHIVVRILERLSTGFTKSYRMADLEKNKVLKENM